MKKLKRSLLILSFSSGLWGVNCTELAASFPKEEDQESALKRDVKKALAIPVDSGATAVLEPVLESSATLKNTVINHEPLFSFDEFKERCPGYKYDRVSIGNELYLSGINTEAQYLSFLTFDDLRERRGDARISLGEHFVERVIESAESPEDTQYEIIRILHKHTPDSNLYGLVGAILIGKRVDDPSTILMEEFFTQEDFRKRRRFVFGKFFTSNPAKIPLLSSYLYSFRFSDPKAKHWKKELQMFLDNGFRVEEVYIKGAKDQAIKVKAQTYFKNVNTKRKPLALVSFSLLKQGADRDPKL